MTRRAVTCTDILTEFLMYMHFQHSDTAQTFVNDLIAFQPFVVKIATENTIFVCHGSGDGPLGSGAS